MRKDLIVYYIINDTGICECYYYGGILSHYFAKCHFNYLCKKYPYKKFFFRRNFLSYLIEEFECDL